MVRCHDAPDFSMEIVVGGETWREMSPKPGAPAADAYVESSLFVKGVSYNMKTIECDPFGEEFEQSWPVTPYEVLLTNRTNKTVWYYLYVDGEKAHGATVPARGTKLVKGMQGTAGQGITEERAMLFARPRLVRRGETEALAASQLNELESIRCDFHRAFEGETKVTSAGGGASSRYDGVNKAACKKAKAGAMTRTGNVVSSAMAAGSRMTTWDVKEVLGTVRIRYGQQDKLERYGVWTDPEESDVDDLTAGPSAKRSKTSASAPSG